MTVLWMAYAALVAALLGGAAAALERGLRGRGRPARWAWAGALGASVVLPAWTFLHSSGLVASGPSSRGVGRLVLGDHALGELYAMTAAPATSLVRLDPWLTVAWAAVSLGLLLGLAAGLGRIGSRARRWCAVDLPGGRALVSPGFGPAVVGVLDPRIVVPRWALALPPHQLRMIVLHEDEHRSARDGTILVAAAGLVALMPWNPGAWWLLRRLRLALEMDCDRRVMSRGVSPVAYGSLLLAVGSRAAPAALPVAALSRPPSLLERRLTMIVRGSKRSGPMQAAAALALSTALVVAACQAPGPVSAEAEADGQAVLEATAAAHVVEARQGGVVRITGTASRDEAPGSKAYLVAGGDDTPGGDWEELTITAKPVVYLYLDGRPIEGDLEQVDKRNIESIEVRKGSSSKHRAGEIHIYTTSTTSVKSGSGDKAGRIIRR